jgi:hypothetical protein
VDEAQYLTGDIMTQKRFGCPANKVVNVELELVNPCHLRFWRVYDVKRHLKADHGLDLDDAEVRHLLGDEALLGVGTLGEVPELLGGEGEDGHDDAAVDKTA